MLFLFLLTACGGGSSTTKPVPPILIPFPRTTADPNLFPSLPTPAAEQTAIMRYEDFPAYRTADNHLPLIKAATAYARGATGMGETVVIVDSGIDASHREFQGGKVKVITGIGSPCLPAAANSGQCANSDHGTAVAALAAGHRGTSSSGSDMHGVAFDAQIKFIPIRLRGISPNISPILQLNDYSWDPNDRRFFDRSADYRQYIAQGKILNYSFGSPWSLSEWKTLGANCGNIDETGPYACYKYYYRSTADALAQAGTHTANKSIVVIAAGNARGARHDLLRNGDGKGPSVDASSPFASNALAVVFNGANDPNLEHVIAVVAVGADGMIASYSNRCGEAKAFCIAAPGGDRDDAGILSARAGGDYRRGRGTSFSAPIVSGSLALLRQYFRGQLGNTELVNRLLATANRTGIYADPDIYGHGLVDLDAATAPVGTVMTGLSNDPNSRPFAESAIALSSGAFGASLQRQLADVEVAGFDALDAPFFQSAATLVTPPKRQSSIARIIANKQRRRVQVTPYQRTRQHHNANNGTGLSLTVEHGAVADARLAFADGWWVSYRQHGGQWLGLYDHSSANPRVAGTGTNGMAYGLGNRFNDPLAFAAPYLSLVRDGAGIGWRSSGATNRRFGFTLMHGAPQFDDQQTSGGKRGIGVLMSMTMQRKHSATGLSLQVGAVRERAGFLGAQTQGAFGKAKAVTTFAGLNGAWTLGTNDHWQLLASAYLGRTRARTGDGLLHDISPIVSSAFSLGAARTSLWQADDWLGLRLAQPLRAERGKAKLRLPVGRTKYGQVEYKNHAVSLAPNARALHVEALYSLSIAGGALTTRMGLQHHPQHNKDNSHAFMLLAFERRF